jgi:hypothetical protein
MDVGGGLRSATIGCRHTNIRGRHLGDEASTRGAAAIGGQGRRRQMDGASTRGAAAIMDGRRRRAK